MSKPIRVFAVLCACGPLAAMAFTCPSATAQTVATVIQPPPAEVLPLQTHRATSGPISHSYPVRSIDGEITVVLNPDGEYTFAGSAEKVYPGKEIDLTLALKSTMGSVILFQYKGDASHKLHFSKHGSNHVLKENFQSFAASHQSTLAYRFFDSSEGRSAAYELREKIKERLRRDETEALQRHDDKTAAQMAAAIRREEQSELDEEQRPRGAQPAAGGAPGHGEGAPIKGGNAGILPNLPTGNPTTDLANAVGTVSHALDSTVGTALHTLGSIGKSVLSFL